MHQKGDDVQAEKILLQALALNSATPDAHYNLGNIYLVQGHINKAIDCFKKTIALDPTHALALRQLAAIQQKVISTAP